MSPAPTGPSPGAASTVVVTGATSGIGREAAVQLAAQEHSLVLVGRDEGRLAEVADAVRTAGAARVDPLPADFARLDSVRELAAEIRSRHDRVDVLVNNAGTVFEKRDLTRDGIEQTFQVNHLAGFLLTEQLKDLVPEGGRIVNVSSVGHRGGTLDLDDLGFEQGGYGIMRAYGRSKLANLLYTRSLAAELEPRGVTVNALHPGTIATNIWSGAPWFARPALALWKRVAMKPPAHGGRRITFLATDPSVAGLTGGYYEDGRLTEPSRQAQDDELAARLRAECARLVGLSDAAST